VLVVPTEIEANMKTRNSGSAMLLAALLLSGCAANITGKVRYVDLDNKPVPEAKVEGLVVNMINTTSSLGQASYSTKTDPDGKFKADEKQIKPGTYKIEVNEPGYLPASKTIEFKEESREVELELRPVPTGGARTYRGMQSDKDKIINPGEVNIQPPSM
jgi:hypothetical protein